MGNTPSNLSTCEYEDIWWKNREESHEVKTSTNKEPNKCEYTTQGDFMEDFQRKRENRKIILEQKRREIHNMREEIQILRTENERLRNGNLSYPENPNNERIEFLQNQNTKLKEEITKMKEREQQTDSLLENNRELKISISQMQSELQTLNSSVLDFELEKKDYKRHVVALKDVIKVSKELLLIRENELMELKKRMQIIENEFNEKEASLMSNDLRKEYERQLANIRSLRELYEERSRTHRRETDLLKSSIIEKDKEIEESVRKISELQERVEKLEKDDSVKYDSIKSLESNLGLSRAECRQFQAELAVINQLFSHILLAFNNSPDLDLDKLLKQLEAHHGLLKDIVSNEVSSEVSSALPKVVLDLVNQISSDTQDTTTAINSSEYESTAAEENELTAVTFLNSPAQIAENLPKVWKVLIELLSHQSANISVNDICEEEDDNRCYKTVVTPKGPSLVLSVSKTFFRLKELIMEKKALEKDMNNLKQLNSHLETRLQDQEKRFDVVSSELSKTWNFVSKLQKEHHLLHTQEKILRYELAQKRKLLKELREELEYSREKWQQAREKNSKTEKEWLILRKEFAARKKTIVNVDESNSVESGYSDEKEESSDEEPGYGTDISECNQKVDRTFEDDTESEVLLNEDSALGDPPTHEKDTREIDNILPPNRATPSSDQVQVTSEENSRHSKLNVVETEVADITSNGTLSNNEFSQNTMMEKNLQIKAETSVLETRKSETSEGRGESSCSNSTSHQTLQERFAARDERLNRLEGQCKALVSQVTHTSHRSVAICDKLEDLHEIYGENSRNSANDQNLEANQPDEVTEEIEMEEGEDYPRSD